jgi:hypothetical protein
MKAQWFLGLLLCAYAGAQQAPSPGMVPPEPLPEHPGTVILSRSVDDAQKDPVAAPSATADAQPAAVDAERQAIAFVAYDLDVHLQPREHSLAVRARIVLRNSSAVPVRRLPLQISSTLQWTSVHIADAPAKFSQRLIDSDIDHTGALREALVPLATPLAPNQSIAVDVTYEGIVDRSTQRLEQIGTPTESAQASDWDRISDDFVGLRGVGNVAWYPVATVPVALGDGARFFTEAIAARQRQSQATLSMRITEEFFGEAPNLAILHGEVFKVTPASLPLSATIPGIVTVALPEAPLGFSSPSLFLLNRTLREGAGLAVFARPEDVDNVQAYLTAATTVTPFLGHWLGKDPRGPLNIVDLPEKGDEAFEDGGVLFANIHAADPDKLTGVLVHSLTHVYFGSPYAWLNEGIPSFMGLLWSEQTGGRDLAIQQLDNSRGALSLAEPGETVLLTAREPVYYRTKATYVFWMLRDLAGDEALGRALRAYQSGSDTSGTGFQKVLERESGKDLKWFFEDWVYHDRGLPDLSIAGVFPNKASLPGSYVVSVDVSNSGSAAAEVPVSVSSGTTTVTERLRVPAKSRVSHRFVLQGAPAEVAVNDGTVPEVEASVHRQTLAVPAASE